MSRAPEIWAPTASTVELVLVGGSQAMVRRADGWWEASVDSTDHGAEPGAAIDYGFRIDGNGPFPDPRSRWQPQGVHEFSRTFNPAEYAWGDGAWEGRPLAGGIIYELHLGTFTPEGTLDAATGRLEHLKSIGVDFVELLPVNAFNGTHNWGYDGVLWYAVHEGYGGPAAYQRFVDACHQAGLGVIQDVVYNHLGPSGNYLPQYGPYLSEQAGNTWGSSLNLDGPDSDPVRRYIIDNALMWLGDYHVDGLRLDAVHALRDSRALHLLEELAAEVDVLSESLARPLTLIAESDLNDPRLITPRDANGYGLAAQWSDDFHHAVHVALTGEVSGYYADFEPLSALVKVLDQGFFHDGSYSSFRRRSHGRPLDSDTVPTWRLVVASQNHDQIGNRAIGDRLTAQLDAGQLGIAAALTLLGPYTPMLFMGEEWGATTPWQFFTSHPEPELGQATAEGRMREFAEMGWDPAVVPDPQDPETFTRSKLDWTELGQPEHERLLMLYRDLARLRRDHPDLTSPYFDDIDVEFDADARWLCLKRGDTEVLVNFSATPKALPAGDGAVLLAFATVPAAIIRRQPGSIVLAPHAFAVLAAPLVDPK
ncbi:malto-oligosyltrehalose trehalohydrolase [Cryobacterium melibiosiphilum]|uniref:Malto-oligosyltrehalose trehalohydrolase n=1 Tax=Cryobacterium melibiosiphilum TaxID=995039 RepID=A0A3A5M9Q5_9MICO|nr:malto-oligosyltrehalose trehalohydrolase [Cryobacterium melibiosiphilum]RJT84563.1 malto-oligosyltrehalose trehalohydrolase [Cryobacterium melibiosiphilum]